MGLRKHLLAPELFPHILALVDNVSRRTHRASLLINHYVLSNIDGGAGFFDALAAQCIGQQTFYTRAMKLTPGMYQELLNFYNEKHEFYEQIPPMAPNTSNALNAAGRGMVTNVINSLWMTFEDRVKRLLPFIPRDQKKDKHGIKYLMQRAQNRICFRQLALNRVESEVLDHVHRYLPNNLGQPIEKTWIRQHPGPILRLYHSILQRCEAEGTKGFSLLPIFDMKAHFACIDSDVLRGLMRAAGLIPNSLSESGFRALKDDHLRSVLKVPKGCNFGEVKTDGVSLRFTVRRIVTKGSSPFDPYVAPLPSDETDYFSNDPGHHNQAFVLHTVGNPNHPTVVRQKRLTYRQHCVESHHSEHLKKHKRWLREIQPELAILSENRVRTSSVQTLEAHLASKIPLYDRLWNYGLQRRMAMCRWDYYIHSRKCVDRFWSDLAYGHRSGLPLEQRPLLKYGGAVWSGAGNRGAPNKRMLRSAMKFFRVVTVPEWGTTVCCATCGERMKEVKERFIGPLREGLRHEADRPKRTIRGLKHCSSNVCRSCPLKSRDGNAAANIGFAWPNRPDYLVYRPANPNGQ